MTELFQQQENADQIIQKLNYPNEITRNLAISACGNLHLFESKEILKNNFRNETLKNQVAIIKSLNNMGDESDIPFLEGIVRNNVISLQLEACRVLYHLSETGRDQLEKINLSMNDKLTAYISHIKDTRN
jgi:HEAT repeat protein